MNIDVVSDSLILKGYQTTETVLSKITRVLSDATEFWSDTSSPLRPYVKVDMWRARFSLIREDSVEHCCDDYLNAIIINRIGSATTQNLLVYKLLADSVLKVCYSEKVLDKQRTLATVSLIVDKDVNNLIEPVFIANHESEPLQWYKYTKNPKLLNMIKGWLKQEYSYPTNPQMDSELIEKFLEPNDMETIRL